MDSFFFALFLEWIELNAFPIQVTTMLYQLFLAHELFMNTYRRSRLY